MQNSEKLKNQEKDKLKNTFFKGMTDKLKEKDEREVRQRLKTVIEFILALAVTYILGGAKLFFGTYPLCIALLCSSRKRMLPVSVGIILLFLTGELPSLYFFACLATALVRVLAVIMPQVFLEANIDENKNQTADCNEKLLNCAQGDKYAIDGDLRQAESDRDEKDEGLIADDDISVRRLNLTALQDSAEFLESPSVNENKEEKKSEENTGCERPQLKLFSEDMYVKMLCGAISGLICGFFLLIQSDFSVYSLCSALILTFGCPIFVAILGGVFGEEKYKSEWYTVISVVSICALSVFASSAKSIIGMPMAPFLSMLFTLYLASAFGFVGGAVGALLCGLAFNYVYIPLLLISSVAFCLISAVKRNAGLAVVCGAVVLWCYYIGGERGLVGVLPPMLLSIPFYMIADKYREMMFSPYNKSAAFAGGVYFAEAVTEKSKNQDVRDRLGALSEAFSSLSQTFYELSDKFKRPDLLGIKRIVEGSFDINCKNCRNRELCWGVEYSHTLEAIRCISSALHKDGAAKKTDLSEKFTGTCIRLDQILDNANSVIAYTTEQIIKGDKVGFFASNYDDITSILKDALNSDSGEYESDPQSAQRVFEYLYSEGFKLGGVVVYGKRCVNVVVNDIVISDRDSAKRQSEICKKISEIVGVELTLPIFEVGKDGSVMRMHSKPRIKVKYSHGYMPSVKNEERKMKDEHDGLYVNPFSEDEECGDMTNAFITRSSYFYSLISDGMGSGAEAAFTSRVCSMFIEKMLSAGNRADITVRMLNNIIRSENMGCGSECSATVDLCELDLISGTASFIKSGAAPTYIARGETIYKINSRTMPVGIIKNADTRLTKFDTQRGDIIVMMSDGCCPDSDDCAWLVDFLCQYLPRRKRVVDKDVEECEMLKNKLLSLARENYPRDRDMDDISVSVILVD